MPGKLDSITVEGFLSFKKLDRLELRPINVLIGANGSGKSNFIQVFRFLRAIRQGRLAEFVLRGGGANRLLYLGTRTTDRLILEFIHDNGTGGYRIELVPTAADHLLPAKEEVTSDGDGWVHELLAVPDTGREAAISVEPDSQPRSSDDARRLRTLARGRMDDWHVYHFHDAGQQASPLKQTAHLNDNRQLRPEGSNLAAVLYLLKAKYPTSYRLISATVRQVAPFFEDFVVEPLRLNQQMIRLEWKHVATEDYFDVSSFSDGTLRFIALATLLLQPPELRPSLILIDEPELGLHPFAVTLLASMIQSAAVDSQIIVSTQSSALVDHFEPEDVLVSELKQDGSTTIRRLDSSELEPWLEDYSLGELWDKNQFGGRPGLVR
jgi:predicted ATPase